MNNRVTVVETVYHQTDGCQPTSVEGSYTVPLSSDEAPYIRLMQVDSEWKPLDTGWVTDAALLVLKYERRRLEKNPTAAERQADESAVVEVGGFALLRPGQSMRMEPVGELKLRCLNGKVKITVYLFQR